MGPTHPHLNKEEESDELLLFFCPPLFLSVTLPLLVKAWPMRRRKEVLTNGGGGEGTCVRGSFITRDGSYGLSRRPIRINTLLIRHTRIIRTRIFAILGGTLGLHQPPSNHHKLCPQPPEHYNASW